MLGYSHLAIILIAVILVALFSRRIEMSVISIPMIFTAFGWIAGEGGLGYIPFEAERETIHTIAEITLVLVLFSDASRVDIQSLKKDAAIPARMLIIAMPLTILFGTFAAYLASPTQPWALALLVAAILTPTDAALGQAVVSREDVPEKIRQGINVESGLNDGLALPVVIIAALLAVEMAGKSAEMAPENIVTFAMLQVILGPVAGIVIGFAFAKMLDFAINRKLATTVFQGIYFLGTAFLCFVAAELVGGNGLIAAFIGGLAFGNSLKSSREFISEFMEGEGQLLTISTFLIFGAVMVPIGIAHASWATVLVTVSFLTIIRIIPVWLALTGTGLAPFEKFFLGWFGPRGLASILFALLILESYPVPGAEEMLACVVLTVMLSIVLHGVTANPMSDRLSALKK